MHTKLLGDHSECDPPDPISNSEVKPFSADGSVGPPHVRVGHRQALILKGSDGNIRAFFIYKILQYKFTILNCLRFQLCKFCKQKTEH